MTRYECHGCLTSLGTDIPCVVIIPGDKMIQRFRCLVDINCKSAHFKEAEATVEYYREEKRVVLETDQINIAMSKCTADDLLSFVKQTITDAQDELSKMNQEDKLLIDVWRNGLRFWSQIKDAIVYAQEHHNSTQK